VTDDITVTMTTGIDVIIASMIDVMIIVMTTAATTAVMNVVTAGDNCQRYDDHNNDDNRRKEPSPPSPPKAGNPNDVFQNASQQFNFIVGGDQAAKSNR
jgi:hypothetical protein